MREQTSNKPNRVGEIGGSLCLFCSMGDDLVSAQKSWLWEKPGFIRTRLDWRAHSITEHVRRTIWLTRTIVRNVVDLLVRLPADDRKRIFRYRLFVFSSAGPHASPAHPSDALFAASIHQRWFRRSKSANELQSSRRHPGI